MTRRRIFLASLAVVPGLLIVGLAIPQEADRSIDVAPYERLDAVTDGTSPGAFNDPSVWRALDEQHSYGVREIDPYERLDQIHANDRPTDE